jgi:DNA-binding MarR family transcriptional regulator
MNKIGEERDEQIFHLMALLSRIEKITDAHINTLLQPIRLTCAQHIVLKLLIEAGEPLPLGQLAEKLHSVRSNVTQMIDRLAAEGLVERIFDATDRRRVLAQITEEGRRRFDEATQLEYQVEQELHTHFSQQERDQLVSLLSRLEALWQ